MWVDLLRANSGLWEPMSWKSCSPAFRLKVVGSNRSPNDNSSSSPTPSMRLFLLPPAASKLTSLLPKTLPHLASA